jgi:chemotaxis protein methyltransferase CheR
MEVGDSDIRHFQETVREHSGYDFFDYAPTSLRRRLARILLEYDMDPGELTRRMGSDPFFLEKTIKKITVHTTELFRDPAVWKFLHSSLLPSWNDRPSLNIWHPGCSTGQEVYSMMMVLDDLGMLEKTNIYGSDLNPDVLETARTGSYKYHFNQSYLDNFDRALMNGSGEASRNLRKQHKKYFSVDESKDLIQMNRDLCSKPVYKKLDLVQDPNLFLVKFDLIVCRNVIIYFNSRLQNRVFELFYENLKDNGVLLLGVHESIMGPYSSRFRRKDFFYYKQKP